MNANLEVNQRLRQARAKAGFADASEAARAFGWNVNTYRSHENGARGLKPSAASRYARAFKVSLSWLITGQGTDQTGVLSGITGFIRQGGAEVTLSPPDEKPILDVVLSFQIPAESQCYFVDDESMRPRYSKGDILLFFPGGPVWDSLGQSDLEGIVFLQDGGVRFGYMRQIRGDDDQTFELFEVVGRGPILNPLKNAFMPLQAVVRLGAYAIFSYVR